MQNKKGQNTHSQGERLKILLSPYNVGKKSANDAGPRQGHNTCYMWSLQSLITPTSIPTLFSKLWLIPKDFQLYFSGCHREHGDSHRDKCRSVNWKNQTSSPIWICGQTTSKTSWNQYCLGRRSGKNWRYWWGWGHWCNWSGKYMLPHASFG